MAKKENKKVSKKKNDKKKNNKKFKDAFSIRTGPRLETWLVWISMFVLGIGFLAFGNVKFYTKQRVKKVDNVPVWTTVETETVTKEFKSDSNNLASTGGYLNYGLFEYGFGELDSSTYYYSSTSSYTFTLDDAYNHQYGFRVFTLSDIDYFKDFASPGYSLDRDFSTFNYYIEHGSNIELISHEPSLYGSEPGVIHSVPYSQIHEGYWKRINVFYFKRSFIDPNNKDPEDNIIRVYPSVKLRFKSGDYFYDRKSYTVFEEVETVSKTFEMVLDYEERVTYYDEFKFNLNGAQFNEVAVGLFDKVTGYISKFLNVFKSVFEFLQFIFGFIIDTLGGLLGKIVGFFS